LRATRSISRPAYASARATFATLSTTVGSTANGVTLLRIGKARPDPSRRGTSSGAPVVRATLTIRVQEGREADFERAWRPIAESVRRNPGNLRQTLLRDPQDRRTFIITSDWVSREAFSRFERSPEQEELTAPLRALRESVRMTVYDVVVHVESEGLR
jgi:heme-degrading monooxygenase HmoA